ncbi:hypothetical protein FPKKA176_contig00028-0040 [Flavobacterium psychrophilum]|nr:hypothetical protein KU06112801_690032 [Flavobacterium psychrophilum]GAQ48855.1 hypothetical protein FPK15_contig00019-0031 [Flavobacterium psychrophilum]GEJ31840.1 hypothetical protein FPN181_contig00060-0012 [Flavobacterium psychrophilum]GEJ35058.1 hypothetical protein FPN184_contig00042-0040 [Flavobacterium psychrophilum]GEJ36352.1 hypothetical protein FPN187_contig00025-0030 [Flavobacterium psychrophilum]
MHPTTAKNKIKQYNFRRFSFITFSNLKAKGKGYFFYNENQIFSNLDPSIKHNIKFMPIVMCITLYLSSIICLTKVK